MLKLNASYSKKVPAEGEYSSQSYHCSMEVELSDKLEPVEIQAKIHETFALVRESVEAELHGTTAKPNRGPVRVLPARGHGSDRNAGEKATNRQVKYVLDLAKVKGITLSEINARVQKHYHADSVYDLTRTAASKLVDDLKSAA